MKSPDKMVEFAAAIADELGLLYPDYENFGEVADFIDEYKDAYYESLRMDADE